MNELQCFSASVLAGQKALALMLPSATDLLGRKHMFSHEALDLLEDGLSFQRLPEQSVVCSRRHRPGETQQKLLRLFACFPQTVASCACLGKISWKILEY